MFPWLTFWAPQVHFPYSNFTQTVEPITDWTIGSTASTAGNPRVERKAVDVASYGRQLGLITEVLMDLAAQMPPDTDVGQTALDRLTTIREQIEQLKQQDALSLMLDIQAKMDTLKQKYPDSYQALAGGALKAGSAGEPVKRLTRKRA